METTLEKVYRTKRREGVPAQYALGWARAVEHGAAIWREGDAEDHPIMLRVTRDISPMVQMVVDYIWDDTACDCWHDWEHYGRDAGEPEPVDHNHFGIRARILVEGEPIAWEQGITSTSTYRADEDSYWGFYVDDYISDDHYAELSTAWDYIAHAEETARDIDAGMSEYTRQMMGVRADD